jgi:small conductance mechanosensitive channel
MNTRVRRIRLGVSSLRIALLYLLIPLVLLTAYPAFAQQLERVTVRVDGRALFRVGPLDELDSRQRADLIELRIANLLENPDAIAPARIEFSQTDPTRRVISVAGVPVVTVTETDAQDNLTDIDALAIQWKSAIDLALQSGAERRLSPGGRFVAEIRSSIETAFASLLESAIAVVPRALASLLVILLFWLLATLIRWLMRWLFHWIVKDSTTENLLKQLAYYAVWTLGIIVAVDALGFDPETVLTGLGLTGLALGFALKDILSNFVSGIIILILRPFQIGDEIRVGDTEGNVERIELRATQIRTYDGRVVLVPNAELFTSRITNNTWSPVRRGSAELFFNYEVDLRNAAQVIREALQSIEGVLDQPAPSVRVRELGPTGMTVEARFWTDSRRSDFLLTTTRVRIGIVEAIKTAGIPLPTGSIQILPPAEEAS